MTHYFEHDEQLQETLESVECVFRGGFLTIHRAQVRLPDGSLGQREFVEHPGAVMVMPVFDNNDVLLVRQYRFPVAQVCLEFPAGKKDPGEDALVTARRELLEETGFQADQYLHVTDIHNAVAYSDEIIHFYLATGLIHVSEQQLEPTEFLNVVRLPLSDLITLIEKGEVPDVKTQLGAFWLLRKLKL